MSATELARNLSRVLDRLEHGGEPVRVVRNHQAVATLIAGASTVTAREAFGGLAGMLSDEEGESWLADCRGADGPLSREVRDPWA